MLVQVSSAGNLPGQLNYYFKRFGTPKTLALCAKGHDRKAIENPLFATQWRRHPGDMNAYDYEWLSDETLGEITFYERKRVESTKSLFQSFQWFPPCARFDALMRVTDIH